MKDLPGNDDFLIDLFDKRLAKFGNLDEDQVQGAQMGMGLMIGSFQEMIDKGLVLKGKEADAAQVIERVTKLFQVLGAHTTKE